MIDWLLIGLLYSYTAAVMPDIVTVHVAESIFCPGESNSIDIVVNVKEGYHIQANKLKDESLIPTSLEIKSNKFFTISGLEFPPAKEFQLEGTEGSLLVFDGIFPIKLVVNPAKDAAVGKHVLAAQLRYQACDSNTCFFPRTVEFPILLEIKNNYPQCAGK